MKRILKPLSLLLVGLLLLTTVTAAAFADSGKDKAENGRMRPDEDTVIVASGERPSDGQSEQRPPMDGNVPGNENGEPADGQRPPMDGNVPGNENGAPADGQRPPMDGNVPGGENGEPADGQRPPMDGNAPGGENGEPANGQRPPMDGNAPGGEHGEFGPMRENDPMHRVLEAVDALEEGEVKTALKALLDAYRDAIEAERNASEEDRTAAAEAVAAARDAVNAALTEASIEAQIASPDKDGRPPMPPFGGAQEGTTLPNKPTDGSEQP